MKKKEWQRLVDHICRRSVAPHIERILERFHPREWRHNHNVEALIRAMRTIRYIETQFNDDQDLSKIFSDQYLKTPQNRPREHIGSN